MEVASLLKRLMCLRDWWGSTQSCRFKSTEEAILSGPHKQYHLSFYCINHGLGLGFLKLLQNLLVAQIQANVIPLTSISKVAT